MKQSIGEKFLNTNLASSLNNLFADKSSADVTLVSDDQMQILAHKSILSASSPVLKNLLLQNPHPHPLIFLYGVKYSELCSILQLMYFGETAVHADRINQFLSKARDLQIKQVAEGNKIEQGSEERTLSTNMGKISNTQAKDKVPLENTGDDMIANNDVTTGPELDKLFHKCETCSLVFVTKNSLLGHIQSIHGGAGARYSCDQCDYYGKRKYGLKQHKNARHKVTSDNTEKYMCDTCGTHFASNKNLVRHIQSKHEGVQYSCKICEYRTNRRYELYKHVGRKHKEYNYEIDDNIVHVCNQCEYQANQKDDLKHHKQVNHE